MAPCTVFVNGEKRWEVWKGREDVVMVGGGHIVVIYHQAFCKRPDLHRRPKSRDASSGEDPIEENGTLAGL
jgi:hypothetical protein